VLASHSMSLMEHFCNRAIVLEHGVVRFAGDVDEAILVYTGKRDGV
jgi:ABC-type polysaccharide/polyol phosphate transport system ATPase subunit